MRLMTIDDRTSTLDENNPAHREAIRQTAVDAAAFAWSMGIRKLDGQAVIAMASYLDQQPLNPATRNAMLGSAVDLFKTAN